jgi:hypothetical protein
MFEGWGAGLAVAAGVGAAGSIAAGAEQASGQKAAANTQADMFNTIVGQEQPFIGAGGEATTELSQLMGGAPPTGPNGTATGTNLPGGYLTETFNPTQADLENYPGYQFQQQQGDLAVQSAESSGGSALSGPAIKSLMSFNQGLAASNYSNYFNQFQTQQNNIFNRLSNIAAMGQNAAGNLGTAGANLGTGIAQAQAAAAGSIAGGISGATNNVGQSILLSNLMNNGYPTVPQGEASPGAGAGTVDAGGGYNFSTGGS